MHEKIQYMIKRKLHYYLGGQVGVSLQTLASEKYFRTATVFDENDNVAGDRDQYDSLKGLEISRHAFSSKR